MESTENRYAHLLKPIRELTKNWEIDVASELNDYLEELDEMCIMFDGGKIQLNFAEAALLIQGSACIYSKKVELLHSLVYQTLENINNRNKQRNKQAEKSQENDADAGSGNDTGGGDEFTPMDVTPSENTMRTNGKRTVNVAPLCPDCLIPPEAFEKNKLPLISVKGEVLCSQRDFRMNLYIPRADDLLVLSLRPGSRFHLDTDLYLTKTQQEGAEPLVSTDAAECAAEDFVPLDDHNMELDQEPVEHVDRHQAPAEGRVIRERRQVEMNKQPTEEDVPPATNVWMLHDPYSVVGEEKPLKPGKCYKIPESLNNGGKKKRKRFSPLQDFRSWFSGTFNPPEHKLKYGPTFTDLNYIYLSTLKDKLKTQRKICRKAGAVVSDEDLRRTFLQPEEVAPQQQGEEPVDDFRHADLLGGGDDSDNEHEAFPDGVPAEFGEGGGDAQRDDLSYEDLVKLRVEQLLLNCQGYAQETALSRSVREWQDKIRPKLALLDERPVLDIHEYEDFIVGALDRIGHRRSFASIVHHLENFEACKYLLASLQLANDQTVAIDSKEGLEESLDTMGLTLLSSHRATDRFKSGGFGLKTA